MVPDALLKLATEIKKEPAKVAIANANMKDMGYFATFGSPNIQTIKPRAWYVPVDKYQCYKFWKFPLLQTQNMNKELKVLTAMGNGRKNGMVMKIFGTSSPPKPNQDPRVASYIPEPVNYANIPEQNPPL